MNRDVKNWLARIGFAVELGVFAAICYAAYRVAHVSPLAFAVIVIICTALFAFSVFLYMRERDIELQAKELAAAIGRILTEKGDKEQVYMIGTVDMFAPAYEAVNSVIKELAEKDAAEVNMRNIINSVASNMELEAMLKDLMPKLVEATASSCGAFYQLNGVSGKLELKHSVGFSKNLYSEFDLELGEGFIGSIATSRNIQIIDDIPEDTVYIMRTFLGKVKPKAIMVIPILTQEDIAGVLVLGSIYGYKNTRHELLDIIKYYFGIAVSNGLAYERTKRLTNELKFQNRLIQNLNDDLEKKIQERISTMTDIIDSITDYAIYATDATGRVVAWNAAAEEIYGHSAQEMLGADVNRAYSDRLRDTDRARQFMADMKKNGKAIFSGFEEKKNGEVYYSRSTMHKRLDAKGEFAGYTSLNRDVTELMAAREALETSRLICKTLIDNAPLGIIVADDKFNIQLYNRQAERIFGKDSLQDRTALSLFDNGKELKSAIAALTENDKTLVELTIWNSGVKVRVNATRIYTTSGKGTVVLSIAQD